MNEEYNGPTFFKQVIDENGIPVLQKISYVPKLSTNEIVKDTTGKVVGTKVIGLSPVDPVGEFIVSTAALSKPLEWAGKGALYGAGRLGNNWARAKVVSNAINENVSKGILLETSKLASNVSKNSLIGNSISNKSKIAPNRLRRTRSSKISPQDLIGHPNKKISGDYMLAAEKELQEMLDALNKSKLTFLLKLSNFNDYVEDLYNQTFRNRLNNFKKAANNYREPLQTNPPVVEYIEETIPNSTKEIFEGLVFPRLLERRSGLKLSRKVYDTPVWKITPDNRNNLVILENGEKWDGRAINNANIILLVDERILPHELRHVLDKSYPLDTVEKKLLSDAYSIVPNPYKKPYNMEVEYPTINLDTRIQLFKNLGIDSKAPLDLQNIAIDNATDKQIIKAFANADNYTHPYMVNLAKEQGITLLPDGTVSDISGNVSNSAADLINIDLKLIQAIKEALKNVGIGTGVVTLIPKLQ